MANETALRLHQMGFQLVLLGRSGDDLKRPILKGWQTADYTADQVAAWPIHNNLGLRCGRQGNGWSLVVLDFDEEAGRVFTSWLRQAVLIVPGLPVTVTSGRGYHVYFYTRDDHRSRTLAARYSTGADGRKRLHKFIETLGRGRQVVTPGSRHPNGHRYRFVTVANYDDIPRLDEPQWQRLVALSRSFDKRPTPSNKKTSQPVSLLNDLDGVGGSTETSASSVESLAAVNCLDYARRFIGTEEITEPNGDIRILGQGGLLITPDGRGWYSFSDDTGGGLVDLIAWHRTWAGEGDAC